jgi:predicted nucleic acid-binding protein
LRFALDSNIILYAEGINDVQRGRIARQLLLAMEGLPIIVPVQALGEVMNVMVRKARIERKEAVERLKPWQADYALQATTPAILDSAFEIVADHAFNVWDAVILACASFAGAETLFSEDMQDGFTWKSTMIVNPFLPYPAPIVRALLNPH